MTHPPPSKNQNNQEAIVPPDGGWGWWVVFASFAIHIVTDGVTYTFGIFFVELKEVFGASDAAASWIVSILVGVTLCSGPFSSAFVNKYGCRVVTIAGCIIAGISLILSSFATNVFTLYITIGLGTGFGFGMIYLPAIVCVTMYFEKLRSLATGIAVCGSGFGTLIFAPITSKLILTFGWEISFCIIAVIVFFCSTFGAMFRPLKPVPITVPELENEEKYEPLLTNKPNNLLVSDLQFNNDNSEKNNIQMQRSRSIGWDVRVTNGNSHNDTEPKVDNSKLTVEDNRLTSSHPHLSHAVSLDRKPSKTFGSSHFERPDVFYTGSLHNIAKHRSKTSINADLEKTPEPVYYSDENQIVCGCVPCSVETKETLRKMMSFNLFKDPIFVLFVISNFLTSIGFNVPYVYVAAQAKLLGIGPDRASYLLSIIGFANTVGRIILGFISDKPYVNRLLVYNLCLTICGLSTAFSVICWDFWSLSVYTFCFGFTIGAYVGLTSVILVDLLGLDNLTNAFGLLLLFQGVASLVGPPIAGVLYDLTKSYTPGFIVAGVTIAFSGIILFAIPPYQRHLARKEEKRAGLSMVPL